MKVTERCFNSVLLFGWVFLQPFCLAQEASVKDLFVVERGRNQFQSAFSTTLDLHSMILEWCEDAAQSFPKYSVTSSFDLALGYTKALVTAERDSGLEPSFVEVKCDDADLPVATFIFSSLPEVPGVWTCSIDVLTENEIVGKSILTALNAAPASVVAFREILSEETTREPKCDTGQ